MTRSLLFWRWQLVRCLVLLSLSPALAQTAPACKYFRTGNAENATASPRAGYALMGGGADLDEAFKWLCDHAGGGDLLVLRATGTDAYDPYIQSVCHLNSVATLIIPSRAAAADPFVAKTIRNASALFIAGGDQANYINFWQGTPVQEAMNAAIRRGVPVGGTSAGLAVLGQFAYTAQGDKPDDPNLDSKAALANPFEPRITLTRSFLSIPILKGIITDSHFAKRDRMGRLLVFLARLNEPDGKPLPLAARPGIRGIGIEERAAILVDADGHATVIGHGSAYFVGPVDDAIIPAIEKPVASLSATVLKVQSGHAFDLKAWKGDAVSYTLSVQEGAIHSTQAGGAVY